MMRLRGWFLAGIAGLCLSHAACALDPAKDISQYVHDRWGTESGFLGGAVLAISQSQDGYLWIGAERGLVRFDGFEFTLIQRPIAALPPIGSVRGLVADAAGNMWVRLDGRRLLRYRDGHFEDAIAEFGLEEIAFTSMSLDSHGELLLWGPKVQLLRFHDGKFWHHDAFPGIVISAAETRDGKLWMGTREAGLVQVDHGRSSTVSKKLALRSVNALLAANDDELWIGTDAGLEFWDGHGLATPRLPSSIDQFQILALTKGRGGNVWVGTSRGIVRITPALDVSTEFINYKSENAVTTIYEDRDGDIWFGGQHGIERLRDGMFTGFSTAQGLPSENNGPAFVDAENRTWFAPASGGLYWLKDGRVGRVTVAGLDRDIVYSISGGGGELWVSRQHGGLTVLTGKADAPVARTYTQADGLAQNSVYSVHRNKDGTVWAGTVSAGISRLSRGAFTSYTVANGLASNAVFSIVEGYNGTMWFATPGALESFADGHWKNYAIPDGLPSSNIRSVFEDSQHVLWIATSGGLAFFTSDRIDVPKYLTNSLREDIFGVAEDKQGSLWIVTSDHVLQVPRDRLLAGSLIDSDVQSYGTEDGLPGIGGGRRDRSVVTDVKGRIWISLAHGLATADPAFTARNAVPVSVRIESISVEGRPVSTGDPMKFVAGTRSITFNYADSNLSVPQRIRFRYALEGSHQGWSNDVALRQVVFTNLGPGSYRFRIVASNGVGVWNGPETVVNFAVQPAYWQTWWFRIACCMLACLIILATYRLQMLRLTQRLNVRFQDRLAERTRIAQELHDTLLQGVLSASMQLDVVEDQTPDDAPTKPLLRRVLQLMGQVTEEGRDALRGLRAPASHSGNIETALSRVRQELAMGENTAYRVVAHGTPLPLSPTIRDDVFRVAREAVVNAFLHAHAENIEVEVEYAKRFFRVLVRDNGRGIDSRVLDAGREGHWGLPGMRERSENIGASLKLRSRVGAGTEVELTVPGTIAFAGPSRNVLSLWRFRSAREKPGNDVSSTEKQERE